MSKKLYSTRKWKSHVRRRQVYQLRRHHKKKKKKNKKPAKLRRLSLPQKRGAEVVRAPRNFSLLENPVEVIAFLFTLYHFSATKHLMLDLTDTSNITTDAVTALLASISALQKDTYIRGNYPNDENARRILSESGFFQHVKVHGVAPPKAQGLILRKESEQVEPTVARDLIHFGTKAIFGEVRRCPAAYRVLIECMNNTRNHAAAGQPKTWWCTVYPDLQRGRICYTFLDTGVGIFRSVRLNFLRRAYRTIGLSRNADIVRELLEGMIESSTGFRYRGKGLPAIYNLAKSNTIGSLTIITNDVYADVSSNDYRTLGIPFFGTLLYWET